MKNSRTRRSIHEVTAASAVHVLLAGFSSLKNPASPFRESQRDSVTQPSGCRVGEATLGSPGHSLPTPTGLHPRARRECCNPVGVAGHSLAAPRVARPLQPRATRRNPVGIREADHKFLRHDMPQQLSRGEGGPISRHAGSETGAPKEYANIPRPVSSELRPLRISLGHGH